MKCTQCGFNNINWVDRCSRCNHALKKGSVMWEKGFNGGVKRVFELPEDSMRITSSEEVIDAPYKVGERIAGQFEVIQILGGGMGLVYIVYSFIYKQLFALKTFQNPDLDNRNIVHAQFKKEVLAWAGLGSHPNIVRVIGVDTFDSRLYIVLEYIEPDRIGRNTLHHYLDGDPLPLELVLKWGSEFCFGMEHAFTNNIGAHRDIKPSNIMITSDGHLKITDFGLVNAFLRSRVSNQVGLKQSQNKYLSNLIKTRTGALYGTPGYIAPEQYMDARCADERSDIYSFGLVLWQMVTGSALPPFGFSRNLEETYRRQSQEDLSALDTPIWPIINLCLRFDPESRYKNFETLHEHINNLCQKITGRTFEKFDSDNFSGLDALITKGLALYKSGEYEEAETIFRETIAKYPQVAEAHNNLGLILRKQGKTNEAIKQFQMAIKIVPEFYGSWHALGTTCLMQGENEKALQYFSQAISIDPDRVEAISDRGFTLYQLERYEEAQQDLEKAVSIAPKDPKTLLVLCLNLSRMKKYREALERLQNIKEVIFSLGNFNYISLWEQVVRECSNALKLI